MKKIFLKYTFILSAFFALISCDSELDQQPFNAFTPDTYYKTQTDFENALRGMYAGFFGGSYYGGSMLSRPDILADNAIIAQRGRRTNQFFYEWRYVANSTWNVMFSPYIITNRANRIIESIGNLPDGAQKNRFLAEAKTARAFAMFDMLRVYSKIPTQSADANASLGMPINTGTNPNFVTPRPSVAESMTFVITELEEALGLIDNATAVDRFSKNAIYALLSRVYLYNGEYQKCIDAANEVLTPVATRANFAGIWNDSNTAGVIFKLNQDRNLDGVQIGTEWSQTSSTGETIPEYVFTFEFFNLYTSNDIRKTAYSTTGIDSNGELYNTISKMLGEAGQVNGIVDPKLLRASEVYLNKAEAYARLTSPNDAQALVALDMVRSNRYSSFVSGNETGVTLLNAIKLERRLELAFEGHRFFDLKRWNEGVTRSAVDGEFFDGTGTPADFTNLPAGSLKFQLPIPQSEINVYPGLQQNPL
jgi:tetratricopeptide (TPR) repeat protein